MASAQDRQGPRQGGRGSLQGGRGSHQGGRGSHQGGRGSHQGGSGSYQRGSGSYQGSSGSHQGGDEGQDKKNRKESILNLTKYLEKSVRVKFSGGREAAGILKGFDPLVNLVLDNTVEFLKDPDDPYKLVEDTRDLGLVVCRGTSVMMICPSVGTEAIQNPFITHG